MMSKIRKILALLLCFVLVFGQTGFAQAAGQMDISGHFLALNSSFSQDKFRPLHLRYLDYDSQKNSFKLLIDKGDLKDLRNSFIQDSTRKLMEYFFVGLALPNNSFWVNLRPDSPENIVDPLLAQTDLGRILLEADVQLKKDTAKMTSPETKEGREYWNRLYKKAEELLGHDNISIPTLTRPWIVPGEIIISETPTNVYIYKATLKVMLEQDYLKDSATYKFADPKLKALNEYASELIRELIIPKLTKEINTSKRYASLRQVYYSLILSQWFKQRFKGQPSAGITNYSIDSRNLTGLVSKEPWSKNTYFKEYQKSFKDGEYNLQEPVQAPLGQSIRSYMSGGIQLTNLNANTNPDIISIPSARSSSPILRNTIAILLVGASLTILPSETQAQIKTTTLGQNQAFYPGMLKVASQTTPALTDIEGKNGIGTILSWNIKVEKPNDYQLGQIVGMQDKIFNEVKQKNFSSMIKLLQFINSSIDSSFDGDQNTVYLKDAFPDAEGKKAIGTFDCDSRAMMLMAILEKLGYPSNLASMVSLGDHMVLWIKKENKFLELTTNEVRELSAEERLQLNEINSFQKYLSFLLSNEATDLTLKSGRSKEKLVEAIKKFDEAIKLDPGNIIAYLNQSYLWEKELRSIEQREIDANWQFDDPAEKEKTLKIIKEERQDIIKQAKEVYRGLFTTLAKKYKELTQPILINNNLEITKLQDNKDPYAGYLSEKFAKYAEFLYFKAEDYAEAIKAWQYALDKAGDNFDKTKQQVTKLYITKATFKAGEYKQFIKTAPDFIYEISKLQTFQNNIAELNAMLLTAKIISGEIKINEGNVKDFCKKYGNDSFLRPFINGEEDWNQVYSEPVETLKAWDGFKQMMELIKKTQNETIKPARPQNENKDGLGSIQLPQIQELSGASSPLDTSTDFSKYVKLTEARLSDIIDTIEKIRGKPLNAYEKENIAAFGDVLKELTSLRDELKRQKRGFPEMCYEATKGTSRILTKYGFRHKVNSNFDPSRQDRIYLSNFVTLNLGGVEFVLDISNEAYAYENTGIALIPLDLVTVLKSSHSSYKYVRAYQWPNILEAKIDKDGTYKTCTIKTVEKEPREIVNAVEPLNVEWGMPSKNSQTVSSYIKFASSGPGSVYDRVIWIETSSGSTSANVKITDIVDNAKLLLNIGKTADFVIDGAKNQKLVINLPERILEVKVSGRTIGTLQLRNKSELDQTTASSPVISTNSNSEKELSVLTQKLQNNLQNIKDAVFAEDWLSKTIARKGIIKLVPIKGKIEPVERFFALSEGVADLAVWSSQNLPDAVISVCSGYDLLSALAFFRLNRSSTSKPIQIVTIDKRNIITPLGEISQKAILKHASDYLDTKLLSGFHFWDTDSNLIDYTMELLLLGKHLNMNEVEINRLLMSLKVVEFEHSGSTTMTTVEFTVNNHLVRHIHFAYILRGTFKESDEADMLVKGRLERLIQESPNIIMLSKAHANLKLTTGNMDYSTDSLYPLLKKGTIIVSDDKNENSRNKTGLILQDLMNEPGVNDLLRELQPVTPGRGLNGDLPYGYAMDLRRELQILRLNAASSPEDTRKDEKGVVVATFKARGTQPYSPGYLPEETNESANPIGGIDFRAMPITTPPVTTAARINLQIEPLTFIRQLEQDPEWQNIQKMLDNGLVPSSQRIKEYLNIYFVENRPPQEINVILGSFADILRLEEEQALVTEPGFQEILSVLESNLAAREKRLALNKIRITEGKLDNHAVLDN